jgi:hypothetical protein
MTQIGFNCPVYGPVLHDECRACSVDENRHVCMYPPPVLENMREQVSTERDGIYSPTQLTGCFRQQVLLSSEDYYADPNDLYAMQKGTLTHTGLATLDYPGALWTLSEERLYIKVQTKYGEVRYGGKPDLVVVKKVENETIRALLIDWKTTDSLSHDTTVSDDYIMQINQYKLILESEPENKFYEPVFDYPVKVDEMELYVLGRRAKRFSSLISLKTKGKLIDRVNKVHEEIELEKIPVLSNEDTAQWVVKRIEERIEANDKLPPVLGPEDNWKCNYCPVRKSCFEIG